MTGSELLVDALAAAIAARIERAEQAEAQLSAFAFREGAPPRDVPRARSHRAFVEKALAAAGDPAMVRLLAALRDGDQPLVELAIRDDLGIEPGDRVALAERIAGAAAAGLVGRELESDRVACTELGAALLDLVDALESGVDAARAASVAGAGT